MKAVQLFGIHEQALTMRARRNEVLANNIANADTPGFKARDLDFRQVLSEQGSKARLIRTDPRHIALRTGAAGGELKYRLPMQPSLDGNTVEPDVEQAAFAENAIQYQASLMFLSGRISGLRSAITGE